MIVCKLRLGCSYQCICLMIIIYILEIFTSLILLVEITTN